MMRQLLIVCFVVSGFSAAAQTFAPGGETNEVSEMTLGASNMLPGEEDEAFSEVHILSDDPSIASAADSTPAEREETKSAEQQRASFLTATGAAYLDEGEEEDAERAYLRALEMDPENDEALVRLAVLYVQMDRYADAVVFFKRQLQQNPDDPSANNNLAWCYTVGPEVRNIPLALRHAREAILSAPRLPSAWNTLAEAYYVSGDYDKALESAELALSLLPREESSQEMVNQFIAQVEKIQRTQRAAELLGD